MMRLLLLLLLFTMIPSAVFAVAMGDIEVQSALKEPLRAEIGLIAIQPDKVQDVSVRLATQGAFARVGIRRAPILTRLRFEPVQTDNGEAVIRVTSQRPIRQPFLDFLVELRWAKGRLLREYSLLLDAPVALQARHTEPVATPAVAAQSAPDAAKTQSRTGPVRSAGEADSASPGATAQAESAAPAPRQPQRASRDTSTESAEVAAEPPKPKPVDKQPPKTAEAAKARDYTTQGGDTLGRIAKRYLADHDISLEQMMIALLRANPDAFGDNNINNLKKGSVLRIPTVTESASLPRQEAVAEVARQSQQWREYRAAVNHRSQPQANPAAGASSSSTADQTAANASKNPVRTSQTQQESGSAATSGPSSPSRAATAPGQHKGRDALSGGHDAGGQLQIVGREDGAKEGRNESRKGATQVRLDKISRRATAAREAAESQRKQIQEMTGRLEQLETLLAKQRQVITLQNKQLSQLEQRLQKRHQEQIKRAGITRVTDEPIPDELWHYLWVGITILLAALLIAVYLLFRRGHRQDTGQDAGQGTAWPPAEREHRTGAE